MADTRETQVTVDLKAARVLERARERAMAEGSTLGEYLERLVALTYQVAESPEASQQRQVDGPQKALAFRAAVEAIQQRISQSVPAGHIADDSRESIYEDRGL